MSGKTLFCRCEDVTLAEIEHAFEQGHRDIESLKRYSGFGTGWCQGKQCVVLCARFLAERAGAMPEAPVTPRPPTHPVPLGHLARLGDAIDRPEDPAVVASIEHEAHETGAATKHGNGQPPRGPAGRKGAGA